MGNGDKPEPDIVASAIIPGLAKPAHAWYLRMLCWRLGDSSWVAMTIVVAARLVAITPRTIAFYRG